MANTVLSRRAHDARLGARIHDGTRPVFGRQQWQRGREQDHFGVARGIPRYHRVIPCGCNHFPVEHQHGAERMITAGDRLIGELIASLNVGNGSIMSMLPNWR